ncbi:MAG: 23S rRNA (adenine(2503)-C(2))-methyltransferase RlmN [Terriglobales bacterium]
MRERPQKELLGLDLQELTAIAVEAGQPAYRGRQLFEALYRQRVEAVDQITTLPNSFRSELTKNYAAGLPQTQKKFVSLDGTVRYLIGFADGQSVETVWMPEGDNGEQGDGSEAGEEEADTPQSVAPPLSRPREPAPKRSEGARQGGLERGFKRATICVSSQAGCAVNCQFCMTALLGLLRNLSAGEIVGQILRVLRDQKVSPESERINLVFMGQGEPFLNYENFMKAVRLLAGGVGIPESRMTVSTAGIVPRIRDFGGEQVRPKLAISLNASNDETRDQVMPINRKWNLATLLTAARQFPLRSRERLTFEYVLLNNVNDSVQNAREVVGLIRGLNAKVNLIALNPGPEIPFSTPEDERVHDFQQTLIQAGIPTFIRRPRGRDIFAACGQLKRAEVVQIRA